MTYELAQGNAWNEIKELAQDNKLSVRFLTDTYDVDLKNKVIFSNSCNMPAKEHVTILVLHYLIQKLKLKILPHPTGEWMDFRELDGGDGYYPAFKKRTIDVLQRKYGSSPEGLLDAGKRLGAKKAKEGDAGIIVEPLDNIRILFEIFKGSEEFSPTSNIVFDKNTPGIFCTEDTVVLTEFITHQI